MRRFFIDKKYIKSGFVIISGKEAHHICNVIRLKEGDRFIGTDGEGNTYTLRIRKITNSIEAEIEKITERQAPMPRILLACAIPKKNKIEHIIEKATELGVTELIPMITERTVIKIDKKKIDIKKERWQRIALEACKQSGRSEFPIIHDPMDFKQAADKAEAAYNTKLIPCLSEGARYITKTISKSLKSIAVFIGPEGDFSEKEIIYAKDKGMRPVSLGQLVLKVDTACVYTLSIIQSFYQT
jgi:16S rRNA (uracil1498-N3)-methyltransferase